MRTSISGNGRKTARKKDNMVVKRRTEWRDEGKNVSVLKDIYGITFYLHLTLCISDWLHFVFITLCLVFFAATAGR